MSSKLILFRSWWHKHLHCIPLQSAAGPYGLPLSSKRQAATHEVDVSLGQLSARAAFSHIPFWQSVAGMVGRIVQRRTPGNPAAAPAKTPQQVCCSRWAFEALLA